MSKYSKVKEQISTQYHSRLDRLKSTVEYLFSTKRIFLAVSGGPDSMLMAFLVDQIVDTEAITILHFNHGVRKDSSDDLSILKKTFPSTRIIVGKSKNPGKTETEFREQRLTFFKKKSTKGSCIFTGHSLSDRVETTIMNSLRGTGIAGIRSIEEISYHKDFCFYRPLLSFSKKEILHMCKKLSIPYCIDETNFDDFTVRNTIRKKADTIAIDPVFWNRFYNIFTSYCYLRQYSVSLQCIILHPLLPLSGLHTCNISTIIDTKITLSILGITGLSNDILQNIYSIFTKEKNGYVHYNGRNFFNAFGKQFIFYGSNKSWSENFTKKWLKLSLKQQSSLKKYFGLESGLDNIGGNKDNINKIIFFKNGLRVHNSSVKVKKLLSAQKIPVFLRRFIPIPKNFNKKQLVSYFSSISRKFYF